MHLNDLHRHLNTLASTPQSVPTWRSLVEALKSQQLVATLATSSDQDKIDIATKLYDIVQIHDLGLQETFFGVDHIKSIIENETIVALANKIELYLKRNALPTEDTATGTPKPSRKERWTNRRNKNKKDDDEPLLENTEPKKSRRERLEEAVAPVVEKRRKTFGKQQETEPPLFTIDLDEGDDANPDTTTKKPSRRTTFREKKAAQCSAFRASVNNRIDGLKTRNSNLVKSAKKNFNEFGQKSKKTLDRFLNGRDIDDYSHEEQGQIGLLGDYAKDFLEDPAHAGQNLTDLILCDYAKSQRHISYKKAYKYLLTLQKAGILTISRWRGIIEIEGVTRPQKVVRDMNNDLTSLESYLIIQLNARKAPTYNELWTWFVDERYGGKDKQPRGLFNDEKLLFSELLNQLVKEGFIITRGRGDKTTYHKGPKFRTHTVAPAQTSHASDNEALDVVYAQMDTKTLQLETRVYSEVLQALKKILENHTNTPTLNSTQLTLLTDAIQLYETQADQLNQINPYTLLTLFDEIDAPIPPLLWEWKNTLEKAYIDHIRKEDLLSKQSDIKKRLLQLFSGSTLIAKTINAYIITAYSENKTPETVKSILILDLLPYFRDSASDNGAVYEQIIVDNYIKQAVRKDIYIQLAKYGWLLSTSTVDMITGIVDETSGTNQSLAHGFAQALTLKKNASEQEEFIDELAYPDMHLAHLQKRPPTTKIDHGTGWKGLTRKFSTAVSNVFADDTPTAKEKEYKDTLSETYLEHCTPHLYTRTINRNENVQIDQETGTITYMLHGHQTSCIVDRKKPEEAMSRIAMESSNSRNDEEKAKIIKALLKSYAENLVDTDGPQKFIDKAGQPCILTVETKGKIVIYIDGTKQKEPFVDGSKNGYEELLSFRSHISSAMEQFIPLDQRLHAERKAATGSVSLPSRSAERNAFNRLQRLSTSELAITTGKIITTPASTKKVRDSSAAGGYREEQVAAKSRDANMILIPAGDELLDKSNAGQHIFTLPGSLTTFWKERTFIRFAEKIIEVKYTDPLANQKRYEVIAEWDSREKVYDNVDMHALLNKEIERMGNDQAIAHMQPLVSFIIPEQHGTDAAQVYYFNPETQERFKGEDKDGHPGISDRDLGDFATDIRSGNVLERGPELKVRVQAFATDKKGRMNRSRFERERITKRPHTLKMRKLEDTQIPRVLKESLHAKKAINDALAACLARLS